MLQTAIRGDYRWFVRLRLARGSTYPRFETFPALEIDMLASTLATLCLLVAAVPATAQDGARTETVHFAKGTSSKTIKGSIKGYASVNYKVGVAAGQTLKVDLKTSNASSYFNITAPGADAAMFVGSTSGSSAAVKIPSSGDYTVQVYLMRNAARRNETASYTLTIAAK